ncbi:uncharacterized protein LOC142338199 [Convolutriloba macropyga]|uniref:uncharacterized protein LOC142338199 n=1 Tax=Convolutriloba macropyga TaxID=536237 RepID=UPI003F51B01F
MDGTVQLHRLRETLVAVFLFALIYNENIVGSSASKSVGHHRESIDFLLPYREDELGQKCIQRSSYFCLMGYTITAKLSDRKALENDTDFFHHIALKFFKVINWYSFKPQDQKNDGCCTHQVATYVKYGQRNGLSPDEYYNKIFGYQIIQEKELVFIKAIWIKQFCVNVITQLGFGKGDLTVAAKRKLNSDFAFPPLGGDSNVPVFHGKTIRERLTFAYFLHNVVCKEKPELCPVFADMAGSSGHR